MKPGLFVALYGPSKAGKTVASAAAASTGIFIGPRHGLLSASTFLGLPDLDIRPARTVAWVTDEIEKAIAKSPPAIVVDDFTLLVDATINQYEKTKGKGAMWSALRNDVLQNRDAARAATEEGIIVIYNCHEQPPRTSSGKYVRGGPAMPGQLPEQFSGMVDVIGRTIFSPDSTPWKYQLMFGPQPDYISGDRLCVFPPISPMNLAEGSRHAGYDIPRPELVSWIEPAVVKLSAMILEQGVDRWRDVLVPAADKLKAQYPVAHVRWALQDSLHRAVIRHHAEVRVLEAFSIEPESAFSL